jgi:streptogramin lyase
LVFDRDGNFKKAWGRHGSAPGELDLPHSVVLDPDGLLHIADRNNARIQVFDIDGRFVRESRHPGTPCGLCAGPDGFVYLAHGHTGLVKQLDWQGNVLGETGGQGKTLGRFGEAHYIAVSGRGEVFVTDTLNWRVQKYVKR